MDAPLGIGKKCKDICVIYACSPKGGFRRGGFNFQVARPPTLSLPTALFPQPLLGSPKRLMSDMAVAAGMGVMHGLSHMVSHSLGLNHLWLLLSAQSASIKDQH